MKLVRTVSDARLKLQIYNGPSFQSSVFENGRFNEVKLVTGAVSVARLKSQAYISPSFHSAAHQLVFRALL